MVAIAKPLILFKKLDQIPFALIGDLAGKMSVEDWINCYITKIKDRKSNQTCNKSIISGKFKI